MKSLVLDCALGAASLFACPANAGNALFFNLVTAQPMCLANAAGHASISSEGDLQHLHLALSGLPKNTGFDVFILQVPKAPFGMSWYQGDIDSDANGNAVADYIGAFSQETFMLAPGVATAPVVFPDDASSNPSTAPIQMYHVGIWFDSPTAAAAAGCANTVTKFNGEHNAGVQAMNTSNFADTKGPLRSFVP